MEKRNLQRKAILARYGRQSMLQWDDVPVTYMNQLYDALIDMMKAEGVKSEDS